MPLSSFQARWTMYTVDWHDMPRSSHLAVSSSDRPTCWSNSSFITLHSIVWRREESEVECGPACRTFDEKLAGLLTVRGATCSGDAAYNCTVQLLPGVFSFDCRLTETRMKVVALMRGLQEER